MLRLTAISLIAILFSGSVAYAHQGPHEGEITQRRLWLCDKPENVEAIAAAQAESIQTARNMVIAINTVRNEFGEPPCGGVFATFTIVGQIGVFPSVDDGQGGRIDLYSVHVQWLTQAGVRDGYAPVQQPVEPIHGSDASYIPAQATPRNCGPRERVLATLTERYGEIQQGIGLDVGNNVMEIYASEGGSWTIIRTTPNGITCLVDSGHGYSDTGDKIAPEPAGILH